LLFAVLLLASCAAPRWPLKPAPGDPALTLSERFEIIRDGQVDGRGGLGDNNTWYFAWDERLNFMDAPVTIVDVNPISHEVFRDKYRGYALVVKDRFGNVFGLGETDMANAKVGDVLRGTK
jgi:hypothetical protein